MATKSKAEKIGSVDAEPDMPAEVVETRAEAHVEIAAPEPVAPALAPLVEITDIVSAPLAAIEEAMESATETFTASWEFDSSTWSKKSFELLSENAAAFFDFAERVAKARNFEEVVELQSRFASERLEAFLRQSKELMEAARNLTGLSAAPLCATRKAA